MVSDVKVERITNDIRCEGRDWITNDIRCKGRDG